MVYALLFVLYVCVITCEYMCCVCVCIICVFSVAFGMRKALMAEQGKVEMQDRIVQLEEDKRDLERQVLELKAKCEAIEKRETEKRLLEEKKHMDEIQNLKKINQQLKAQIESIIAPGKK